jgi:hypothetical protein
MKRSQRCWNPIMNKSLRVKMSLLTRGQYLNDINVSFSEKLGCQNYPVLEHTLQRIPTVFVMVEVNVKGIFFIILRDCVSNQCWF